MTTPALSLDGPRSSDRITGVGRAPRHEPILTAVGALGVVATAPSVAAIVVRGSFVAPQGNLAEAAKFTTASPYSPSRQRCSFRSPDGPPPPSDHGAPPTSSSPSTA